MDVAQDAGVLARQFWRMTPADLVDHVVVHQRRQGQEWERAAWMVHHIMSAFVGSKKAPSVDKLLGRVVEG